MDGRLIGRSMMALVSATLLLDGFVQLRLTAISGNALAAAGFTPTASPLLTIWALGGAVLLLMGEVAPLAAISNTAMLGYAIAQHPSTSVRLGCLVLGLAMWLGLALVDPAVGAVLARTRFRRPA